MNNSNKDANLKEKLKQALASTIRVISDDLEIKNKTKITKVQKNLIFLS